MSVPFALFSANGTPGATGATGAVGAIGGYPVHTIGESYGGGIVFFVYDGGQHGLIAATADRSTFPVQWGTISSTGTKGDGLGAGAMNTTLIVAHQLATNLSVRTAAKACADYSVTVGGISYGDWYLPSKYELNLLYIQKTVVGGFASQYYSSSNESDDQYAWLQHFGIGFQINTRMQLSECNVRAVRSF